MAAMTQEEFVERAMKDIEAKKREREKALREYYYFARKRMRYSGYKIHRRMRDGNGK